MKLKTQLFFFLLLFSNFLFSQQLKLRMLEQLSNISMVSIDEYMSNAQGFKKLREENDGRTITYVRNTDNDINKVIIVKVLSASNRGLNALDVTIGKNIDLQKFKNELIDNDYNYKGINNNMLIYEKNKTAFLIREQINAMGTNQIMFIFE